MAKTILLLLFFLTAGFFAWWSYTSVTYEILEHNLTEVLQRQVKVGYLNEKIIQSIEEENFDDVQMYQNLSEMLELPLASSTHKNIELHNGLLKKSWRNTKAFTSGFIEGESSSMMEMSGSIVSDLTLYGDLRDLKKEGTKYMDDKPYDAFILNISLVGIGLSASQLLSVGATTPLKVGASTIKIAKKSGKLTKPFTEVLSKRLSRTVDTKLLKTLEFNSLFKVEKTKKTIAKSIDIKPVKSLFNDISLIKKNTSLVDTISLMKYVDTPKDLKTIGKISNTYKANTKGILKVLGKKALRVGKSVIKFTTILLWKLAGLVLSVFGFFFVFISKIKRFKKLKNIAS